MDLYDDKTRITCITIGFVMFLVGISGNSLIIWTFIRIKRLRILQNVFIVLLAVVDLLITGYLLPFSIATLLWNKQFMPFRLCAFNAIFAHLLFTTCLQLITCIAVSRYVKICHSQKFDKIYTKRNIWLISLFSVLYWSVSALPIMTLKNPFIFEKEVLICIFDRFEQKLYTNMYITFCLVVPITISAVMYAKIFWYVRSAKLRLYRKWNNGLARQRIAHELKVTWCQFAIFVVYLILYVPFGVSNIIGNMSHMNFSWLGTCGSMFAFLNSSINGILYGVMNNNIRKAYSEALPCLRKRGVTRILPMNEENLMTQTSNV